VDAWLALSPPTAALHGYSSSRYLCYSSCKERIKVYMFLERGVWTKIGWYSDMGPWRERQTGGCHICLLLFVIRKENTANWSWCLLKQ
jgi:hypothetical protein